MTKTALIETLTTGTTVVVTDDEGVTRYVVQDGDDLQMAVTHVGPSHSTMNGGGFDFYGHCPVTGVKMSVRTTLARPATMTFKERA